MVPRHPSCALSWECRCPSGPARLPVVFVGTGVAIVSGFGAVALLAPEVLAAEVTPKITAPEITPEVGV